MLLHLALKAFYPGQAAVPAAARRHHLEVPGDDRVPRPRARRSSASTLIVHVNQDGLARGIDPFAGAAVHTDVMKTEALKQALDARLRRRDRRRAARRGEEPRQGAHLLAPHRGASWDPRSQRPELWHLFNTRSPGRDRCACSRCRTGPSSTCGNTSGARTFRSCRSISRAAAGGRARRHADRASTTSACRCCPSERPRAARVRFRTLGCYPLTGAIESRAATVAAIIAEIAAGADVGAAGPADRPRRSRLDGDEEARGLFLMGLAQAPAPSTRACCASSPAARSTTASRR